MVFQLGGTASGHHQKNRVIIFEPQSLASLGPRQFQRKLLNQGITDITDRHFFFQIEIHFKWKNAQNSYKTFAQNANSSLSPSPNLRWDEINDGDGLLLQTLG